MNKILPLFILVLLAACKKGNAVAVPDNKPETIMATDLPRPGYQAFKDSVAVRRALLKNRPYNEVSDYFFHLINNDIYYYWKGTTWAFYGMTRTPKKGAIACGYFVTTTLFDIGLKIDRIKLAQCASGEMIKALCTDIHTFYDFKKMKLFIEQQPVNSVFIVGLDYHTGYIVKDTTGCYFLHSNYINKQGVVKEDINSSAALINNKLFMIGNLTANKKLLQKWVNE